MKKYYWICVFFIKDGKMGYHPVTIESVEDGFLDLNMVCHQISQEFGFENCTVINWKEISEEWFNKTIARSVTDMERGMKDKK